MDSWKTLNRFVQLNIFDLIPNTTNWSSLRNKVNLTACSSSFFTEQVLLSKWVKNFKWQKEIFLYFPYLFGPYQKFISFIFIQFLFFFFCQKEVFEWNLVEVINKNCTANQISVHFITFRGSIKQYDKWKKKLTSTR